MTKNIKNIAEISKAEFIKRITSGKSLFLGMSPDMNDEGINAIRKERLERHKSHTRTCEVKSNYHLIFDGESHLDLKDVKPHTFIKCYVTKDNILVVEQKWIDFDWNGDIYDTKYKYLYYMMTDDAEDYVNQS